MRPRPTDMDSTRSPIDIAKQKWTISTTNFWALLLIITGGVAAYYDLKKENAVRDVVVAEHAVQLESATASIKVVDQKVTDTHDLLLKVSAELTAESRDVARISRQLERADQTAPR